MIRPVERNEATSAAAMCWFPVDNLAGSSPLQEGVEDHSRPPPHTADFLTLTQPAGMGYPSTEVQSPAATFPSPRRSPVTLLGKSPSAQQYPGFSACFKQPFQKGLPTAVPRQASPPLPPALHRNWELLTFHCSLKTGAEAGAQEEPVRSLPADASLGSCRQQWESSSPPEQVRKPVFSMVG